MLKKILYLFTVLFFTTISYAQNIADTSIVDEKLETEIIEEENEIPSESLGNPVLGGEASHQRPSVTTYV